MLSRRAGTGKPHVISNSYGYLSVPPRTRHPGHEIHNLNHPLHRKVREVVTHGAPVLFAAGNCGTPCPSDECDQSGIGPGKSIHGPNSLEEVMTVAAVNKHDERLGYSSQGPGMFAHEKPDFSCYSHFYANFGPGRPGGQPPDRPFDSGTSAATPVAAGVVALLMSRVPGCSPGAVKDSLIKTARSSTRSWNPGLGFGIIDAYEAAQKLAGIP